MHRTLTSTMIGIALTTGCGGGLQLQLEEAAHRRPSNVAVFFTVDESNGDPVPGLTASDFRIYEDGELVSIDESKQTIVNPEQAAEHYTLLLIDMSGSVTESDQVPLIETAATNFTSTVEGHQKVGIYAFDGSEEIHAIQPFTRSAGASTARASRLTNYKAKDPSTNLHGAVVQGIETLHEALDKSKVPLAFGTLVVFTDGTDRAHRVTEDEMSEAIAQSGFDIFAIGVGNEIQEGTLSTIGESGWVRVEDAGAVDQAFQEIGNRIVGYTQRFYLLSYCSPARAGKHEVTIEAVKDNKSGSLTYEFDAEGFGPKCNPEAPPPFDTSGRRRRRHRSSGGGDGSRADADASAGGSLELDAEAE